MEKIRKRKMRSYIFAGLTLLSILSLLSFGGMAVIEKGIIAKNTTLPLSTTVPINKNAPISMNMANRTGNGSMSMSDVTIQNIIQNITLNIVLIQNLTEITNNIMPSSINATNEI